MIHNTKYPSKLKDVSKTKEELLEILNKHVKETLRHFKKLDQGWKLDKDMLVDDILFDILGFSIHDEFSNLIHEKGLYTEITKDSFLVREKEDYNPIYYNERTGKIVVIDEPNDKSYIFKYNENKGWYNIGRL